MRILAALVCGPLAWTQAAPPAQAPALTPSTPQARLAALVAEALAANPEIRQAQAAVEVEEAKIPQAKALPDPVLAFGLTQDPARTVMDEPPMGRMFEVMASQVVPWPGKRFHQETIAVHEAKAAEATRDRLRLSTEGDLRRAYLGLVKVREQQRLLEAQALLWQQAEAAARARYEGGQGAQSDWLRAQLESLRLDQRRLGLASEVKVRLAEANRLLGRPLDADLPTPEGLEDHGLPAAPTYDEALAKAEKATPELDAARHHVLHAEHAVHLSHLGLRPDFQFTAGVMTQPGMRAGWKVEVGLSLPIWAKTKQRQAAVQWRAEARMHGLEETATRRLIAQRVRERVDQLEAAARMARLYREGLLAQSRVTAESALAQYEVGRVPFSAVLEGLNGVIADQDGYLGTLALAQAQAIALDELALGPAQALGGSALGGGGAMGSGGAMPPGRARATSEASAPAAAGSNPMSM